MDKDEGILAVRCQDGSGSEAVTGSESSSFFSSLELQSRYSICKKIEECIEQNGDAYYLDKCFANDDEYGDMSVPPRSHTGGKWKPGSRPDVQSGYRRNKVEACATRKSKRAVWKGLPEGFKRKTTAGKPSESSAIDKLFCADPKRPGENESVAIGKNCIDGLDCENRENNKDVGNNEVTIAKILSRRHSICPFCESNELKSKLSLLRHCKEEHKSKIQKCGLCEFKCVFVDDMERHVASTHNDEEQSRRRKIPNKQMCDMCDYSSNKRADFLFHLTNHQQPAMVKNNYSGEPVAKYRCPVCTKFLRISSMRQHIYKHTSDLHYECKVCNRQFIQRGSLRLHLQTHSDTILHCDKCLYSTKSKSIFNKHMLIHTNRERLFECDECGSKHFYKVLLNRHKQTHLKAEDKPLKCTEKGCGKTFVSKADFAYHLRVHSNECPYECDVCDYKGKTSHQLKKHKRSHTGEKPFQCSYCSYATAYSSHLTRHLLIHSGEKPYTCPYCKFRCNSIENIRKHILSTKKHHGKRVYPCKFCDQSFNECSNFKAHLTSSHNKEFPDESIDIGSVIAGLYQKIEVRKDIPNPIPYTPKTKISNDKNMSDRSVKKIRRAVKKRDSKVAMKRKKETLEQSNLTEEVCSKVNTDHESNNIGDIMLRLSESCDLTSNVPALVDVRTEQDVVTALPCLPSDQLISADKEKTNCLTVDDFSSSLISIEVDNQQLTVDNEALNFIIESVGSDGGGAVAMDPMELMHLVTLSIPELAAASSNQPELADESPVFIYV